MFKDSLIVIVTITFFGYCGCHRILIALPIASQSHQHVFDPLIEALYLNQHDVTVITSRNTAISGPKILHCPDYLGKYMIHALSNVDHRKSLKQKFFKYFALSMTSYLEVLIAKECIQCPDVKHLYSLKEKLFDLIIMDGHFNLFMLPLSYLQKAQLVIFSPSFLYHYYHAALGNVMPPSVHPASYLGLSDDMDFEERIRNLLNLFLQSMFNYIYTFPVMQRAIEETFNISIPSIYDLMSNTNLVLVNTHFAIDSPRPSLPNMIEVGGIHCRPAKELSEELQKLISKYDGFIYFSLGSLAKSSSLPQKIYTNIFNALQRMPYLVLIKWEDKKTVAPNMYVRSWLPQQDLLGNPKIKLFITQGGLVSLQEAIYHAVPLIGLPLFGDQKYNMKRMEKRQLGKTLDIHNLEEEALYEAMLEVINNDTYKRAAIKLSYIFKDQAETSVERAAYWIEYILRHNGSKYLMYTGRKLHWYQFYSIDVMIFVATVIIIVVFCLYFLLRNFFRFLTFIFCPFVKNVKRIKKVHPHKKRQ